MRLKELRKAKKLRQSDVAKVINCSQAVYSRYENGEREPSAETLKALADFHNVTVDYILGREAPLISVVGTKRGGEPKKLATFKAPAQKPKLNLARRIPEADYHVMEAGLASTRGPATQAVIDNIMSKLAQLDEADRRAAEGHIDFLLERKLREGKT